MMSTSMRSISRLAALCVALISAPALVSAQSASAVAADTVVAANTTPSDLSTPPQSLVVAPSGPRVLTSALSARTALNSSDLDRRQDDNVNAGPNLALMGAGAAGIVIGLLIGGDGGTALAVGGGVVGLVGLYRYLR